MCSSDLVCISMAATWCQTQCVSCTVAVNKRDSKCVCLCVFACMCVRHEACGGCHGELACVDRMRTDLPVMTCTTDNMSLERCHGNSHAIANTLQSTLTNNSLQLTRNNQLATDDTQQPTCNSQHTTANRLQQTSYCQHTTANMLLLINPRVDMHICIYTEG